MTTTPDSFVRFFPVGTLLVIKVRKTITHSFLFVDKDSVDDMFVFVKDDGEIQKCQLESFFEWFMHYKRSLRVYSPKGIEQDLSAFYPEWNKFYLGMEN